MCSLSTKASKTQPSQWSAVTGVKEAEDRCNYYKLRWTEFVPCEARAAGGYCLPGVCLNSVSA